jgi:hypothetical protein
MALVMNSLPTPVSPVNSAGLLNEATCLTLRMTSLRPSFNSYCHPEKEYRKRNSRQMTPNEKNVADKMRRENG